ASANSFVVAVLYRGGAGRDARLAPARAYRASTSGLVHPTARAPRTSAVERLAARGGRSYRAIDPGRATERGGAGAKDASPVGRNRGTPPARCGDASARHVQ